MADRDPRVVCGRCDGGGSVPRIISRMECCGRTTKSGECRGHCVIEVPDQDGYDVCPECNGYGFIITKATDND